MQSVFGNAGGRYQYLPSRHSPPKASEKSFLKRPSVASAVVVLVFRRLLERWDEDEYLKIDRTQDVEKEFAHLCVVAIGRDGLLQRSFSSWVLVEN
jgi:hypothetical protein